jgi:uncharacterized protein (DUF433 family)
MSTLLPAPSHKQHITQAADVCGGRPCVAGTRIRVQDIYVWHEMQGQSPDEIVTSFPQLTLADVYAALAHFWDHQAAILSDMGRDKAVISGVAGKSTSKLLPHVSPPSA